MGNRSFLYINKKENEDFLFAESNNSLPFFWLTLLSEKHLEKVAEIWLFLETCSDKEAEKIYKNDSANLKINYSDFIENSKIGYSFIDVHYNEVILLYEEFIKIIKKNFNKKDILEMDLLQYRSFYEDLENFISDLSNNIKGIKENKHELCSFLSLNDDPIAFGSGFLYSKGNDIPSYDLFFKNRNKYVTRLKTPTVYTKNDLIFYLIMLLICPVFSYVAYRGFLKEGFSLTIILTGIVNIFFYVIFAPSFFKSITFLKNKKD